MKQSYRFINFFIIIVLIIVIVFQCTEDKPDTADACCAENPDPFGRINEDQARDKIAVYLDHQYSYINENLNENFPTGDPTTTISDNREIWFDLENFKEYICYVEQESETLGYENLGLRVYLGAVMEEDSVPRTTVFFWPTHRIEAAQMNTGSRSISDEPANDNPNSNPSANENSEGIEGKNYGGAGKPPKVFLSGN